MPAPAVTIQEGQLIGTFGKNLDGEEFLQFFGIPYGKPPVGELRFKPPQPIDPWPGVKDATQVGNASLSRDVLTGLITGSEDCLYLNVYTKKLPNSESKPRPVMVYIHGGGLTVGSSRPGLYGPEFLMTKDIVLVTLNYRLGILGFLSFDDPKLGVTGNMGLKDQILALKWVQKNIAHFNGDPNSVTVFGESAGASSIHAHILSPCSKGLFHRAILQSGCALNSWFWGSKNNAREIISQLGKTADCEEEALEILKKLPALEIFEAQEKLWDPPYPAFNRHFAAVIETPSKSAVLTQSPVKIMKEGTYNKVPIMMGYTETEGMLIELDRLSAAQTGAPFLEFELENVIPYELNVTKGSHDSKKILNILEKLYSGKTDNKHYDELTDGYFLAEIIETLRDLLKTSHHPIFLYRMSLAGNLNFLKRFLNKLDEPGVSHEDDLGYLFHSDITPEIKPGSLEDKSVRTFVELWTNFAEYGNPTPDDKLNVLWKPVKSEEHIKLLDIGENLAFKDIPEQKRVEVWSDILKTWPPVRFG